MCLDTIKAKIKERYKEWIYCDIERLKKENERAKLWAATFICNAFIFMIIALYSTLEGIHEAVIVSIILEVYCILMAADSVTDRNRINMWIYLKENVGNEERITDIRR